MTKNKDHLAGYIYNELATVYNIFIEIVLHIFSLSYAVKLKEVIHGKANLIANVFFSSSKKYAVC